MPTIEDYVRLRRMGSAIQEIAEMQAAQGAFIEQQGNALLNLAMGGDKEAEEEETRANVIMKRPKTQFDRDLSSLSEIDRLKDRKEFDGSFFQRSLLTF